MKESFLKQRIKLSQSQNNNISTILSNDNKVNDYMINKDNYDDWPEENIIQKFFISEKEKKFDDSFFDSIDLSKLLSLSSSIINYKWIKIHEIYYINYIIQILQNNQNQNLNINPKFIYNFINSSQSQRKMINSILQLPQNYEINQFMNENLNNFNKILSGGIELLVVDVIKINESIEFYELNKEKLFLRLVKKEIYQFLPSDTKNTSWSFPFFTWINSIFQIIIDLKLKDVYDNSLVWCKIYPQNENGIPIINPTGRYWVKLYFMGKIKKIEIDDRVLVNEYNEILLPKSKRLEETWTYLLTKAIMKLYYYKYTNNSYLNDEKIGDISILYSLLGYIGETINLELKFNSIHQKLIEVYSLIESKGKLEERLKNKKYVICYSTKKEEEGISKKETPNEFSSIMKLSKIENKSKKESIHLNKLNKTLKIGNSPFKIKKQLSIKKRIDRLVNLNQQKKNYNLNLENENTNFIKNVTSPICLNKRENELDIIIKNMKTNLIKKNNQYYNMYISSNNDYHYKKSPFRIYDLINSNFAYVISDFFHNYDFNMDRLKSIYLRELNELVVKAEIPYRQMNKEEKKAYLVDLFEMKKKQKEAKKIVFQKLLSNSGKVFYIKIGSNAIGLKEINYYNEFKYSDKQISIAKYCIIYKQKFPPIEYYIDLLLKEIKEHNNNMNNKKIENNENNENSEKEIEYSSSIEEIYYNSNIKLIQKTKSNLKYKPILSRLSKKLKDFNKQTTNLFKNPSNHNSSNLKRRSITNSPAKGNMRNMSVRTKELSDLNLLELSYDSNDFNTNQKSINWIIKLYDEIAAFGKKQSTDEEPIQLKSPDYLSYIEDNKIFMKDIYSEWIGFNKFLIFFDKMIFLSTPKAFLNESRFDFAFNKDNSHIVKNIVYKLSPNIDNNTQSSSLIIIFESYSSYEPYDLSHKPSIYLSIFSLKSTNFLIPITLKGFYDSIEIPSLINNEEYFIIIESSLCQYGFYLTILSNHNLVNIPYSEYLLKYRNFSNFSYEIDLPAINNNSYYVIFKSKVYLNENDKKKDNQTEKDKSHQTIKTNLLNILKNKRNKNNLFSKSKNSHFNTKDDNISNDFFSNRFISSTSSNYNLTTKQSAVLNNKDNDNLNEKNIKTTSSSTKGLYYIKNKMTRQLNDFPLVKYEDDNDIMNQTPSHTNDNPNIEKNDADYDHESGLYINISLPELSNSDYIVNNYIDIYISSIDDSSDVLRILNNEMFDLSNDCYLCITLKYPYTLNKQKCIINFLGNMNYRIDSIYIKERFDIEDRCTLYQNHILFKELILFEEKSDLICLSLLLKFKEYNESKEEIVNKNSQSLFIDLDNNQNMFKLELTDFNGKVINSWEFKNYLTLHNLVISQSILLNNNENDENIFKIVNNDKFDKNIFQLNPNSKFYLMCYLLPSHCDYNFPSLKRKFDKVIWKIKIISNLNLNIFQDISKEILENKQIESWEKLVDRKEKAKASRGKFLNTKFNFNRSIKSNNKESYNSIYNTINYEEYEPEIIIKKEIRGIRNNNNNNSLTERTIDNTNFTINRIEKSNQSVRTINSIKNQIKLFKTNLNNIYNTSNTLEKYENQNIYSTLSSETMKSNIDFSYFKKFYKIRSDFSKMKREILKKREIFNENNEKYEKLKGIISKIREVLFINTKNEVMNIKNINNDDYKLIFTDIFNLLRTNIIYNQEDKLNNYLKEKINEEVSMLLKEKVVFTVIKRTILNLINNEDKELFRKILFVNIEYFTNEMNNTFEEYNIV